MKQNKITQLALSALVSIWIAGSLSVTAIRSLDASCSYGLVALVCASAAAFAVLVSINRITAAIAGTVAVGAGVFLCVTHLEELREFLMALSQSPGSVAQANVAPLILALAALWTLFLFATTHTRSAGFLALAFTLLYWLLIRALAGSLDRVSMLLSLVGVAALFAVPVNGRANYLKALLPTALIAAILTMALLPAEGTTFAPLADAAQRVRSMFDAYFSFTDTRVPYSIYMDGYQPLGESLGGPAEPHDWPIMEVTTDRNLYLRGSIRRTYVNTAWTDAVANNRYLFSDLMKQSVREDVFEARRVDPENSGGAFERVSAQVTMLNEGTSTLFVPHRLSELSSALDLAVYYNSVGEVFITRDVQDQDAYGLIATVPSWDHEALRDYIEAHNGDDDPQYQRAASEFMQLPNHIESGVYALVNEVTAGALTPYQRAVAIEQYLEQHCEYTLTPDYPRKDIDFVSDFLLNTKQGYCSYFASAMAVMGRIAGLPTRYVEGYRVEANPFGLTVVTGENAHAWVEVYFNGVGWVTFDPTPGSGFNAEDNPTAEGELEDGEQSDDPDDPFAGDAESQPTEQPTEEPDVNGGEMTPEPTDDPGTDPLEQQPTEEPTLPPEGDQTPPPEDGETPPPEDAPTPPPEDAPDAPRSDDQDRPWLRVLMILLIVLAILALLLLVCWLRLRGSDPAAVARRHRRDIPLQALIYYRAMLTLLETLGQVPESGETPVAFSRRLARSGVADRSFVEFSGRLSYGQYTGRGASAEDVQLGRQAYDALVRQLHLMEKLRWYWARLWNGLGSVEQIP